MKIEIKSIQDTLKVNQYLLSIMEQLKSNKVYDCIIEEHKERRSLSANSYFHLLVNKLAEYYSLGNQEMKTKMVLEYGTPATDGRNNAIIVKLPSSVNIEDFYKYAKFIAEKQDKTKCNYYLLYKETHKLNSKEMARLIDGVVYECEQVGIETKTQEELKQLIDLWEKNNEFNTVKE